MNIEKRTLKFKMIVPHKGELEFFFDKYWEIFKDNLNERPLSDKEWKRKYPNMFFANIQSARRCAERTKKAMKRLHSKVNYLSKKSITLEQKFKVENNKLSIAYWSFGQGRGKRGIWLNYELRGNLEDLENKQVKIVSIVRKDDEYYAHLVVDKPCKEQYVPKSILGIDRGLKNVAVAVLTDMQGRPLHNPWYFGGSKILYRRRRFIEIRASFCDVKRMDKIKNTKDRERNFVIDVNHKVSRRIVDIAYENKCVIVLEDLSNIQKSKINWGKRLNYFRTSWSYGQLRDMILYKAKELGAPIVFVNSKNTSKQCSKCKQLGIRNKLWFSCPHCGFQYNADANAGKNIADRGREFLLSHCTQEKGIAKMPMGR